MVGRSDEHAIDAIDGGDVLERIERLTRLDLNEDADLAVRLGEIAGDAAIAAGARRNRHAANAVRRIARRRDRRLRFLDRLHIRNEQRLRADVEATLDENGVVPGRPDDSG